MGRNWGVGNKAVTRELLGGAKRCLGMNEIQRNTKTHYTFFCRQLPVLPLRWRQHFPPKVGTVPSQYLASHPRTYQFLMSLLARTSNLTLKNVVQRNEISRGNFKHTETEQKKESPPF